jgi:hypothetical protein
MLRDGPWVQAVGGIVAIFAAFGVARYTVRSDQKRKAVRSRLPRRRICWRCITSRRNCSKCAY